MSQTKNLIQETLKPIVARCKRRGFICPGSEIYGGFAMKPRLQDGAQTKTKF